MFFVECKRGELSITLVKLASVNGFVNFLTLVS